MIASQCRCLDPTERVGIAQAALREAKPPRKTGAHRRVAIGLLVALIVVTTGMLQPSRTRAQDAPAQPKTGSPSPAQAKSPATKETEPRSPATKEAEPGKEKVAAESLSLRYRFFEKYAEVADTAKPELIVQKEIGSLETFKIEVETPQGAPLRNERTTRAIYTELPARVGKLGEVLDLVREYRIYSVSAYEPPDPAKPPLKDLSVWCHFSKEGIKLHSLTPGRLITELEFHAIADQIIVPQLTSILPTEPIRVGDVWPLRPRASRSLLGRAVPDNEQFAVEGTLVEVRKAAQGTKVTAQIEISGSLTIDAAPAAVHAFVYFEFDPSLESAARSKAANTGIIEARGHFSRVLMTRRYSKPLDADGRLHKIVTRELTLVRRPSTAPALKYPDISPGDADPNTWISYQDPEKRFHFNHPQELVLEPDEEEDRDLLQFLNRKPTGIDVLGINIQKKDGDPARNRQLLDPDYHIKNLRATWQKSQQEVVELEPGWLPVDPNGPQDRKVYRFEAALKQKNPGAPRVYYNYYLLLDKQGSIVITGITQRNDHLAFRNQVEEVIKTIAFDAKAGPGGSSPRTPASAPPAPPR